MVRAREDGGEELMLIRTTEASIPRKMCKGKQKTRWKNSCNRDMESVGLKADGVLDRTKWKRAIQNSSGESR